MFRKALLHKFLNLFIQINLSQYIKLIMENMLKDPTYTAKLYILSREVMYL